MTLAAANEVFLGVEAAALHSYAAILSARGATIEETNAALERYRIELEEWRASSLGKIQRILIEPHAPSHALQ